MASFDTAINITLPHEGGLTTDKGGGLTKYGISQNAYPNEDIRALTLDRAKALYERDYWNKLNLNQLSFQPLANQIFDIGVNSGVSGAKRLLKDTLITLNIPIGLSNLTLADIARLNKLDGQAINNKLAKIRADFYKNLVVKNPDNAKYKKGWLTRAASFLTTEPAILATEAGALFAFFLPLVYTST